MPFKIIQRLGAITQGSNHRWWALAAVECGNFVVYMDAFIVALALPTMARQFGLGIHEVKWVMLAYLVALTASLLLAGRLADRFGRRTIMASGSAILAIGSGLCFLAPTFSLLIAARILQGIGGALILANVMAEITARFAKAERRRAMAFNASVLALGQVVGMLVGGMMIEVCGWRSIFLVILGFAFASLLLDLLILQNHPSPTPTRLDILGASLSILVVGAPFFIIEHLVTSLAHPIEMLLGIVGVVGLLGVFVWVEWKQPFPLIDLRLARLRAFVCGSAAAACYFIAASSAYFLIPLYAQMVMGLSPLQAGLLMLPLAISLTAVSQWVGRFSQKLPARVIATFGLLCTALAVFGLSHLGASGSVAMIAILLFLAGAGGGFFHPPNNTSVLSGVPQTMLGSANGFFTTARNFGQAIGVSIAAALLVAGMANTGAEGLLSQTRPEQLDPTLLGIYASAQDTAFRVTAAFALAGAIFSALRGSPITASPENLNGTGK